MKHKILPILLSSIFFCATTVLSQAPCAFDVLHQKQLRGNAAYARQIRDNNKWVKEYIQAHPELARPGSKINNRQNALYTIPVVVHVLHTGGIVGSLYNPSDAQINDAIDYLNQVFSGELPGMTAPVEGGGVVNLEVQFALAQRTPSCGATNGIERLDASSIPNYSANGVNANTTSGASDLTVKNFSRWDPAQYYNIWVVNRIDGADGTSGQFIAGYAYLPGAPSVLDGTVMLASQMQAGEKTLPHEIGHALGLYHPFDGSNFDTDCPDNSDCLNEGDGVCDTDPVTQNLNLVSGVYNFACRTNANSCTGTNHNINTESNFMSYTNCYTLFTNGQKARIQAAMNLSSRQSLVDPSNLALVPCGTTINFNQSAILEQEDSTGTLAGCRRYRDYTYQLNIGTGPSAAATATLVLTGSATRGTDYDVTTNGNFSSPSEVLNFAANSTASQTFTIRVYDDAEVEPDQNIIVDFNVNDGGGNAAKGTTAPTLTFTIADNDQEPVGLDNIVSTVGLSNVALTQPFRGEFADSRTQMLFTRAELAASGLSRASSITALAFNVVSKVSTGPFNGFTVRLKNTSSTAYIGGSFETGATQVYTGNYTTVAGINTITLTTPFVWNGTDNLMVEICYNNTTASGAGVGTDLVAGTSGLQQSHFTRGNGAIGCSFATALNVFTGGGARPDIRFTAVTIPTAVETVAGAASNRHMETSGNEYFYSENNRLIMKLSGNDASLSCVSSVLEEAGTSWVNYRGGQRSAKVFTVTPASNGSTASYQVSLYFNKNELDGKTATSLRLAKTSAASIAASNGTNTILVTPTVTTLGPDITVFTASFTGFSKFYLVDPAVTLPVNLVDFTGQLNSEQNTALNWQTASEINSRGFDVETSRDGIHFELLGHVASQGSGSITRNYQFIHIKPGAGTNWYRLKQIDINGQVSYSKIVFVKVNNVPAKPFLYPVPAKDVITINFGKPVSKMLIQLYSADMRLLRTENINEMATRKDLNISALPRGIYFIRMSEGPGELLRFVKE